MTAALNAQHVRAVRDRIRHELTAEEQNAFIAADHDLLDNKYLTTEVAALIAAAQVVVTAKAGASVLGDMTASVAALNTALAITATAGGV